MNKNTMSFETFRAGFPALTDQTYLSIADKMILNDTVRGAIDVYLDRLASASVGRLGHEAAVEEARGKFAQLVNTDPKNIAVTRNVSDGINCIAWSFEDVQGKNVVLSTDVEHPNNIYPWLRQQKRGLELRLVPATPDGQLDTEAMIAAMDDNTIIMTCPSVSFAPGYRSDLDRLGAACRKRDVFFLVDGVQSAGVLQHDFAQEPIDGFATSASKGLLGSYGIGFLYISDQWLDRLTPAYLSRPAVYQDSEEHSTMGSFTYQLQPNARRYEVGSYNLAGAYAVAASLGLLLDLGPASIQTHVLGLASELRLGLQETMFGPRVTTSDDPDRLSHIITIGTLDAGGHDSSTCADIMGLSAKLKEHQITHAIRRGQIRMAVHAFNNSDDISKTLYAAAQYRP
jgi:selenocysteine lyase/cysteine desulfurase